MGNYACERKTKEQSDEKQKLPGGGLLQSHRVLILNTCTWTRICSLNLPTLTQKIQAHLKSKPCDVFHIFLRKVCSKRLYFDTRSWPASSKVPTSRVLSSASNEMIRAISLRESVL